MPGEPSDELTDEERAFFGAQDVAADLAERCRRLRDMDASVSSSVLDIIVNYLMTELCDQSFSQAEIRKAFSEALADMSRYAGSEKRPADATTRH
jgi:hypothetical protein